jgi:hypothetical protein
VELGMGIVEPGRLVKGGSVTGGLLLFVLGYEEVERREPRLRVGCSLVTVADSRGGSADRRRGGGRSVACW